MPTTALPAPFDQRVRQCRARFKGLEVDALLITREHDIRYLSDYPGEDCAALLTPKRLFLISDFRYQETLSAFADRAEIVIRRNGMHAEIAGLCADLKIARLGIQSEYMTIATRRDLAGQVGAKTLRDTSGVLAELRAIKDAHEVKRIRRAVRIAQDALAALLPTLKAGQTEAEISARLKYELEMHGASSPSFPPIIAVRANGSKPHYTPSPRAKLAKGHPLLIDWGARCEGYCSDLTRTFGFGGMPKKVREIYAVVLEAQQAAIAAIRPGAGLAAVDAVARDFIAQAGYGECFGHGLGHGIGFDVHEAPGLSYRSKTGVLKPGHVVTVEPGIYLPGVGGVRIEDDVLVTEKGATVLSSFPKDLESAILPV